MNNHERISISNATYEHNQSQLKLNKETHFLCPREYFTLSSGDKMCLEAIGCDDCKQRNARRFVMKKR